MSNSLYIVVPVFNEAPNLDSLLNAFGDIVNEIGERFRTQIVLVDDGSSDGTASIACEMAGKLDLQVLTHAVNLGPGCAFATGFAYLAPKLHSDDWVVTMEGDNTSRHELIKHMLVRTKEGYDVVLASPYMYGGGFAETSLLRRILSSGANLVVKDLLEIQGVLTVSSFFRLYRGATILHLQKIFGPGILERAGFESMVEMVMKMMLTGTSISEIAMRLDSSRRKGKSKMKILRTIRGYLALWFRKTEWRNKVQAVV